MRGWLFDAALSNEAGVAASTAVGMDEEVFRLVAPNEVTRHDGGELKVLLIDVGAKDNIVRSLLKRGASVIRGPGSEIWPLSLKK